MRKLFALVTSLFFATALLGQGFKVDFLDSSDGLSNSSVIKVFQDSDGVMWLGTWDGLNSWNGRNFNVLKSDRGVPSTISGNVIWDIAEDSDGFLWVCTDRGVDRLDRKTMRLTRFFTQEAESIDGEMPFAIYVDSSDVFVSKDRKGIFRLVDGNFVKVFDSSLSVRKFRMDGVIPVILDKSDNLYRNNSPIDADEVLSNWAGVNDSLIDGDSNYAARNDGLYVNGEKIIGDVHVLSVFKGTQGIVWAGTDMRGVAMVNPQGQRFTSFTNLFGGRAVRCILEDEFGRLLIGTKGAGIYLMTPQGRVVQRVTMEDRLLSNSVYCAVDDGRTVWIGTEGAGLNYVEKPGRRVRYLEIPDALAEFTPTAVYSILPQGRDTLWTGTSGGGLLMLRLDGHTLVGAKRYDADLLGSNVVYSVLDGGDGSLWIGTRGAGVRRLFISEGRIEHIPTGYDVLCLSRTADGCIWAGTSTGLDRIAPDGTVRQYTEKNGLPNNTVHGIVPDSYGGLWLSTNGGLALLDTSDDEIMSFFAPDGIQDNEFSDGAYYAGPTSGLLYFGGIRGITRFDPYFDYGDGFFPPLLRDGFFLDNEPATMEDHMQGGRLTLPHRRGSFSFRFVPLDYLNSHRCELEYLLEGFNRDWVRLGNSSTVVFSNLRPGNYELRVRCSSADHRWSEEEYVLPVRITRRWWESFPAFVIYLVLLALLVNIIMKIRKERADAAREKEIQQAKLRFYSDMGYEFSNALTLMSGPSAELQEGRLSSDQKQYLQTIESSSNRMQGLVKQLIAAMDDIPQQEIPRSRAVYQENEDLSPGQIRQADLLVVDADAGIRAFIGALMSSRFNITEASGGDQALEKMAASQPSLIISAYKLSGKDGLDFLSRVRSDERFRHIPFIMISAHDSVEKQIEALEKGADAYIPKPFNPKYLIATAESLLGRGETLREYGGSARSAVQKLGERTVKNEDKALIVTISDIIIRNMENEALSSEMVAEQAALSKMQLYRKLKAVVDMSPTEFIRHLRLENARKLLKTSHKTAQEIMYACGFSSKTYFYREFQKKYGMTPKQYRDSESAPNA